MEVDAPAPTWMPSSRPDVTLTFDLYNLIRSPVRPCVHTM